MAKIKCFLRKKKNQKSLILAFDFDDANVVLHYFFMPIFKTSPYFFLHSIVIQFINQYPKKPNIVCYCFFQHVDDIDLFVGGLAERPLSGAVVGPTFGCLLGQQFQILKKGDRFWFENNIPPSAYSKGMQYSICRYLCS